MELLPLSSTQSFDAAIIRSQSERGSDHVAEARYCNRRIDAAALKVVEKQDERYQVEGMRSGKPQS